MVFHRTPEQVWKRGLQGRESGMGKRTRPQTLRSQLRSAGRPLRGRTLRSGVTPRSLRVWARVLVGFTLLVDGLRPVGVYFAFFATFPTFLEARGTTVARRA